MPLVASYRSFNSGIIEGTGPSARAIEGQSQLAVYQTGLRRCNNWIPITPGPLDFRPGTNVLTQWDAGCRLFQFFFNDEQVYLFAFSDLKLDVYRNDILVAGSITTPWTAAILNANALKFCQSGDTWIGLSPTIAPTKVVRNGSDSSWLVSTVSFSSPPSDWTASNYPRCGVFHQNRLILAASQTRNETLWSSCVGDLFNFATATGSSGQQLDSDGFQFTLNAGPVHTILDMASVNNTLILHTNLAEIVEQSSPLDATSVNFQISTRNGSASSGANPVSIDTSSCFVDHQGRVRSFSYSWESNQFVSKNLSTLTAGLVDEPTRAAYLRGFNTSNFLFYRNPDGTIVGIVIDFDNRVQGFFTWSLGGGALVEDICVLNYDDPALYMLVSWNGHRYIVRLTQDCFLDLYGESSNVTPLSTWTGWTQFANKTVTVIGDGNEFQNVAVDNTGSFTLASPVSAVFVGLPYTALAETMPLSPVLQGFEIRGDRIRKVFAYVFLRNSSSIYIDGRRADARQFGGSLLDKPEPVVDTCKRITLGTIGPEPTTIIEARRPFPTMLVAMELHFTGNPMAKP